MCLCASILSSVTTAAVLEPAALHHDHRDASASPAHDKCGEAYMVLDDDDNDEVYDVQQLLQEILGGEGGEEEGDGEEEEDGDDVIDEGL